MGFFGKLFFGFLLVVAVLAVIGYLQTRRSPADKAGDEVLSQKTVDNVLDLNDHFNRARYQDKDGE
ncbi:MAG: hypothetical protein IJK63_05005 [Oscillospiraceae bacterium]|nr:hypothetical protein [Oscillospiraceae bacterium]